MGKRLFRIWREPIEWRCSEDSRRSQSNFPVNTIHETNMNRGVKSLDLIQFDGPRLTVLTATELFLTFAPEDGSPAAPEDV